MRLLAHLLSLVALAAAGWLGWQIRLDQATVPIMPPEMPPPAVAVARTAPEPIRRGPLPAIFGEPQPPAPPSSEPSPPSPRTAPAAPRAGEPQPPLSSLGYRLNGVVRTGGSAWATLAHPAGERLVRVGDLLQPGVEVVRIEDSAVWISRAGGDPERLGFPD